MFGTLDQSGKDSLNSELEHMRYIVQIKQSKLTAKGQFNQFKVTGTNINGSLGIGSDEESTNKIHHLH